MSAFRFKAFGIEQTDEVFKVGTDAVLLGAWSKSIISPKSILDIGCGTGIIALMLAQRFTEAIVVGLDSGKDQAKLSSQNFSSSPFSERMHAIKSDLASYSTHSDRFDLIVTNPPYFENDLKPETQVNTISKHASDHRVLDWVKLSLNFLNDNGVLNVIVPFTTGQEILKNTPSLGVYVHTSCTVKSKADSKPMRMLLALTREPVTPSEESLIIYSGHRLYSEQYKALTKDFHPFL